MRRRFQAQQRLAQSYLGELWTATSHDDAAASSRVLIRRIRVPEDTPPEARRALARCATGARSLTHENVLPVLEILEGERELEVVYEYLEVQPLRSLLSAAGSRQRPFTVGVALRLVIDLRSSFRRALTLGKGDYAASLAFVDALLWLEESRAALVWAERAAAAIPKSARVQIQLGDARAKANDLEGARAAWQQAQQLEPGNAIAARRLRQ